MSDYDYVDYKRRQVNIWLNVAVAWVLTVVFGTVVRYELIADKNTQVVIAVLCLVSALVFCVGILASAITWLEKKILQ